MYDLCLNGKSPKEKERQSLLARIIGLGWHCIAWNVTAVGKVNPAQTKPLKPVILDNAQLVEANKYRSFLNSDLSSNSSSSSLPSSSSSTSAISPVRQFSRVTVIIDDVADAQTLCAGNEALKQFDLVAARPGNSKVFAYLCKQAEVDIIDLTQVSVDINFSKKLLDEAVVRGVHFEINYGGVISNPTARRELLSKTKLLVQYLRGRNIIITSAAETFNQVRGPHDVLNIAKILQISNDNAIRTIKENCVRVIQHAYSRKLRYLPVEILSNGEFRDKFPELLAVFKSDRDHWSQVFEAPEATAGDMKSSAKDRGDITSTAGGGSLNSANRDDDDNDDDDGDDNHDNHDDGNMSLTSKNSGDDEEQEDDDNSDDSDRKEPSNSIDNNLSSYKDDLAGSDSEKSEASYMLAFSPKTKTKAKTKSPDAEKTVDDGSESEASVGHCSASSFSSSSSSNSFTGDFIGFGNTIANKNKDLGVRIGINIAESSGVKRKQHQEGDDFLSFNDSNTSAKNSDSKKHKPSENNSFQLNNKNCNTMKSSDPHNSKNNSSNSKSSSKSSDNRSSSSPKFNGSLSTLSDRITPSPSSKSVHASNSNSNSNSKNSGNRLLSLMKGKKKG